MLTRWITHTFEQKVNWQIINLEVPVTEWHDAPILYLSGSIAPELTDEHRDKLRRYVHQGGTLLSISECEGRPFDQAMRGVYAKLFPKYELRPLPSDHEIYDVHYRLNGRPRIYEVSNGVRPLALHVKEDLPLASQFARTSKKRHAFEGAANLYLYVTDKGDLRARGTNPWPEAPEEAPNRSAVLAQVKWNGNYDPEPLAHERFARLMARQAETKVELLGPLPAVELAGSGADVATLTGTGRLSLTSDDRAALVQWVRDGGTLVVDGAGGDRTFADSARELIAAEFSLPRRLSPAAGLYRLDGYEIDQVSYRRRTRQRRGNSRKPRLAAVEIDGRPAVFFSEEDLTAALVGYPAYTVSGYDPGMPGEENSAFQLLRNIVLLATGTEPGTGGNTDEPTPGADPAELPDLPEVSMPEL